MYKYLTQVMLKKILQLKFIEEKSDSETSTIKIHFESIETMTRMMFRLSAHLCSIFFYFFDDVLLMSQLKLINSKILNKVRWVYIRNVLALCKNILHLLTSILEIRYLRLNELKIEDVFDQNQDIKIRSSSVKIC
jgi:hypothetical protein